MDFGIQQVIWILEGLAFVQVLLGEAHFLKWASFAPSPGFNLIFFRVASSDAKLRFDLR
jgi:hypothetical protein